MSHAVLNKVAHALSGGQCAEAEQALALKHVVDLVVDMEPCKTSGTEGMDSGSLRRFAEDLMTRRRHEGTPYVFSKPVSVLPARAI